jgi:hydroxypyruvate reductase/glycerate 2-kinase
MPQQQQRENARSIWQAAVDAANPFERVRDFLASPDNLVRRTLAGEGIVRVCGGGKAGAAMAAGVEAGLADVLDRVTGLVNVPAGSERPLARIRLAAARPAGSNHPTQEGVQAVEEQLSALQRLRSGDVGLCLLSGGGSALLPAPVQGVSLADKQEVTRLLHACGATIDEMNCVRKHLSRIKGGRLALEFAARKCPLVTLIISDVVGDPLDVIASGPTAPDPTTFADALAVLRRFDLEQRVPAPVLLHLHKGVRGEVPETMKDPAANVHNLILCNNALSLAAASSRAEALGYQVLNLGSFLEGETRQVAVTMAGIVRSILADGVPARPPVCLLSGGETTVTLGAEHGKGGRNQEFTLAMLTRLGEAGMRGVVVVLSGGTDGEDGPTDAAGAVGDTTTLRKAASLGLNASAFLERHDAYPFFEATDSLLKTGLTQTNVMDVRVVLIDQP